jgi:hypothetical protein
MVNQGHAVAAGSHSNFGLGELGHCNDVRRDVLADGLVGAELRRRPLVTGPVRSFDDASATNASVSVLRLESALVRPLEIPLNQVFAAPGRTSPLSKRIE